MSQFRVPSTMRRGAQRPADQGPRWSEVVQCAARTGAMDCLPRVGVADMAHCSRFIMDALPPSVQDRTMRFVLDRVHATTAAPLGAL